MNPIYIIGVCFYLSLILNPEFQESASKDVPYLAWSEKPMVVAHRGSHTNYPENSIASINASILKDIDLVEIDIRQTKDEKLIAFHDATINRTTNGSGRVRKYRLHEIKKFRLQHNGINTNEHIPTFEEVLKTTNGKIILNLDFKIDDLAAFEKAYELISEYELEDSVIITVYKLKLIPALYKMNNKIRIMPVTNSRKKLERILNLHYIEIIQLKNKVLKKDVIEKLNKQEVDIWVNALGKYDKLQSKEKTGFQRLLELGKVQFIQTDHPEELMHFLRNKNK